MANHTRALKPGQTQNRRAAFCLKILGFVMLIGFVSAATIGIALPSVWNAFFVPTLVFVPALLIVLVFWFVLRAGWFKLKDRHYKALAKLANDPAWK